MHAGARLPSCQSRSGDWSHELRRQTEAKVDSKNPDRWPLLIVSGEFDHTVPWAVANASYKREKRNPGVTEIVEIKGRGHSLIIDSGRREVADTAAHFRATIPVAAQASGGIPARCRTAEDRRRGDARGERRVTRPDRVVHRAGVVGDLGLIRERQRVAGDLRSRSTSTHRICVVRTATACPIASAALYGASGSAKREGDPASGHRSCAVVHRSHAQ